MNSRFLKNILFLLFINLLVKPFWILGVDRTVQNIVGDASYGTYLAIFNFSYLFYIILDIGLTNYNSKEIAQNNSLLSKYFVGISQAKIFLSIAYFIIIFVIGLIIGYNTEQMKLLAVVGLNQVLLSFVLYVRSNISALLLFKTDRTSGEIPFPVSSMVIHSLSASLRIQSKISVSCPDVLAYLVAFSTKFWINSGGISADSSSSST